MSLTDAQEHLLDHWQKMHALHSGIPARSDFRIQDIVAEAPYIVVLDILRDPDDFRYRLIGTAVLEHLRLDYSGQKLSGLDGKGPDSEVWKNLAIARDSGEPHFGKVPYVGKKSSREAAHTLYLPLAKDHTTPDKIILIAHYEVKKPIVGTASHPKYSVAELLSREELNSPIPPRSRS
jgi:hypothetical protein